MGGHGFKLSFKMQPKNRTQERIVIRVRNKFTLFDLTPARTVIGAGNKFTLHFLGSRILILQRTNK